MLKGASFLIYLSTFGPDNLLIYDIVKNSV